MYYIIVCYTLPLQRRTSCDTEALPIQLDNKDVNLNLDLTEVAERSSRKIYDKINVSGESL